MVLEQRNIRVLANGHYFPLLHYVTLLGKRTEIVFFATQEHFPARHFPTGHHLPIELLQGNTDGGIELIQTCKCHSFYFKVNGSVEQLHRIFNQGLVLGMAHTGGIDR